MEWFGDWFGNRRGQYPSRVSGDTLIPTVETARSGQSIATIYADSSGTVNDGTKSTVQLLYGEFPGEDIGDSTPTGAQTGYLPSEYVWTIRQAAIQTNTTAGLVFYEVWPRHAPDMSPVVSARFQHTTTQTSAPESIDAMTGLVLPFGGYIQIGNSSGVNQALRRELIIEGRLRDLIP